MKRGGGARRKVADTRSDRASGGLVLVLNAGSSSLKAALFSHSGGAARPAGVCRCEVSGLGGAAPQLKLKDGDGRSIESGPAGGVRRGSYPDALALVLDRFAAAGYPASTIDAAGHRVVHGGTRFTAPVLVDDAVLATLDDLGHLAPHHVPPNIAGIRAMGRRLPTLPQVACFDTAFHAGQKYESAVLPLPKALRDRGYRRYGFHGLSYAYIVGEFRRATGRPLPRRTIIAHLGNGASMCAVENGTSIATTMGFSTLDGLVMGTRCGSMDPGVLVDLVRRDGLDAAGLEDVLYNQSGLFGLSGISGDMKTLLASREPAARDAVSYYCAAAARHAAALMVPLGGCDAIVFTGGIGENGAPVRARIVERLAWAGARLDATANRGGGPRISPPRSPIAVFVVPTDEESMIARETRRICA